MNNNCARKSKTAYDHDTINTLTANTLRASNVLSTIYPMQDFAASYSSPTFQSPPGITLEMTSATTNANPHLMTNDELRPFSVIRLVAGSPAPSGTIGVLIPPLDTFLQTYPFPIGSSFQCIFHNGTAITGGNANLKISIGGTQGWVGRISGTGTNFTGGTASWNSGASILATFYRIGKNNAFVVLQGML